jgi:acetyl esterase/lipase
MKSFRTILVFLLLTGVVAGAIAAQKRPPQDAPVRMEGARAEVFKEVGGTKLNVHIFAPKDKGTNRAAIVFFFGGGWTGGSPVQFEDQCRHFAERGMVAISAEYRVKSRHGVQVNSCVEDAKSCVRWVRKNAARLGIDPNRIAAGGGSAGGHLSAATATVPGHDTDADRSVSCVPNALVLFNPALMLAPIDGTRLEEFERRVNKERLGAEPSELSPIHHVKRGTPPAIIFHGTDDQTVPFGTARAFEQAMKKAGNRCELVAYEGQGHSFFNAHRQGGLYYRKTLDAADEFLVSLGYIPPLTVGGKTN